MLQVLSLFRLTALVERLVYTDEGAIVEEAEINKVKYCLVLLRQVATLLI